MIDLSYKHERKKEQLGAIEMISDQGAREKLLTSGAKLFAAHGLDGVSIRDIATESGLNLSLISYYFGGKEGLYVAIIREFALNVKENLDVFLDRFEKVEFSREVFREFILNFIDNFIELRLSQPHAAMMIHREKLSGMPNTKDVHDQIFQHIGNKVKNLVVKGQKVGVINKKINPDFFMCCLAESITGYFVMAGSETIGKEISRKCYQLPEQKNEFKNQIAELFLEGILK